MRYPLFVKTFTIIGLMFLAPAALETAMLNQYKPPVSQTEVTPQAFFESHVRHLIKRFPEILWFADAKVAHTQAHQNGEYQAGWTQLMNQAGLLSPASDASLKYIELERMLSSIHCFYLMHLGHAQAYQQLVGLQAAADRLSTDDFLKLHRLAREVAPDQARFDTVVAALIYSDLGKTPEAKHRLTQALGRPVRADHDDFIHELLSQPAGLLERLLPSYQDLPADARARLGRVARAVNVHQGHVLHLEGGSRQLFTLFARAVSQGEVDADILEFARLVNYCDVAAAAAQTNFEGSLSLKHSTFRGYEHVTAAIEAIKDGTPIQDALDDYISLRADDLTLPHHTDDQKLIIRLACQLRLYDKDDAQMFSQTYYSLADDARAVLKAVFTPEQGIDTWQRNPTYVPGVLNNLKESGAVASKLLSYNRVLEGAVCLAQFFEKYSSQLSQQTEPFNCNELAGLAKKQPTLFNSQTFSSLLVDGSISLNQDGQLRLAPELQEPTSEKPKLRRLDH